MENPVQESEISLVSEGSELEGKVSFHQNARIYGIIRGEVTATPGTQVVIGENGVIEGTLTASTVFISGFVQGKIIAQDRLCITSTGRVVGEIHTPSLQIEFGAFFEGSTYHLDPVDPLDPTTGPNYKAPTQDPSLLHA